MHLLRARPVHFLSALICTGTRFLKGTFFTGEDCVHVSRAADSAVIRDIGMLPCEATEGTEGRLRVQVVYSRSIQCVTDGVNVLRRTCAPARSAISVVSQQWDLPRKGRSELFGLRGRVPPTANNDANESEQVGAAMRCHA